MKDIFNNALGISKILAERIISEGDAVIDATLGSGEDAAFLADAVGSEGRVYAFDIQKYAVEIARERLKGHENIVYINDSHSNILNYVDCKVSAVFFNLGYMHRGDRNIKTDPDTVIKSLEAVDSLLKTGGASFIVVYRGHSEGKHEWRKLCAYAVSLPQSEYNAFVLDFPNQVNDPPGLIVVEKRK